MNYKILRRGSYLSLGLGALLAHSVKPPICGIGAIKAPIVGMVCEEHATTDRPELDFVPLTQPVEAVAASVGDVTVALTGVSATGSVGSLTPSTAVALTGVSGTGSVGSVTPSTTVALA